MRRVSSAVLLSGLLLCSADVASADANYASYDGFTVSEDAVLPKAETHPSLWFKAADVPALRAKRTADDHAKRLWDGIAKSPMLTQELPAIPPEESEKEVVHKYFGVIPQIAALHGLMYQMAENDAEKQKHAKAGIAALLRCFDGYLYDIDPKPSGSAADEIYRAVWMQNAAAAYDWLQPAMTADENAKARAMLKKEAAYVRKGLDDWADRPHNHLSKPAWGVGTLALTLSSEPEAKDWLQYCLNATNKNTKYFFSKDGIYREGSQYYIFSAINFIPFFYHYKNVSGVDDFAAWQPAFEWPIIVRNGHGWMPNIEDSYIRPYFSEMIAGAYKDSKTKLSSTETLGGVLMWNLRNTNYDAFQKSEGKTGFNYTGASWDYHLPLTEFLCYDPSVKPTAPDGPPTVFMDGGETVFRDSWTSTAKAQRYLLFQGVAEADNHMHSDHLSFILQAEGQMMASDSGYSRSSYGEKIRKEWYVTPEAHNVVIVDGYAPQDAKENETPLSRYNTDTDWFDVQEKEGNYPGGGKLRRLIAFIDNDHFVVMDRVSLPAAKNVTAVFHGGRGAVATKDNYDRWTYAADQYGPAAALDVYTIAKGATREQKNGEVTYIKGDFKEFPYMRTTVNAQNPLLLQLLMPGPADKAETAVKILENTAQSTAVEIALPDGGREIIIARNSEGVSNAGGVETDAAFAVVILKKDMKLSAMVEGKYLKVDGKQELTGTSPVTVGKWEKK